jgi:hypothetical protein
MMMMMIIMMYDDWHDDGYDNEYDDDDDDDVISCGDQLCIEKLHLSIDHTHTAYYNKAWYTWYSLDKSLSFSSTTYQSPCGRR